MQSRQQYGGQAVIEGVMIRGRTQASVAVRGASGQICVRSVEIPGWAAGSLRRIPYVRGMVIFIETLIVGMRALSISASLSMEEEKSEGEPESYLSSTGIAAMMVVALGLGIGFFFLVPLFISKWLESSGMSSGGANFAEGGLRLAAFVGYVWVVGRLGDIQRVLAYHGAEHMIVAAHESGDSLTIEAARKYPTAHPRCGTAFLLTVMLVSILVFMVIPRDPLPLVIASRIFLIPLIAAVSYEFIRFAGRHPENLWIRIAISPSLLLQELTTRAPDDAQIEVAIAALESAVAVDQGNLPTAGDSDAAE